MKKNKYKYKGQELSPIKQGNRAYLETERGRLLTSCVVRIIKHTNKKLVIETENSIYDITVKQQTESLKRAI